jgi:hypothetical protein
MMVANTNKVPNHDNYLMYRLLDFRRGMLLHRD